MNHIGGSDHGKDLKDCGEENRRNREVFHRFHRIILQGGV